MKAKAMQWEATTVANALVRADLMGGELVAKIKRAIKAGEGATVQRLASEAEKLARWQTAVERDFAIDLRRLHESN